MQRKNPPACPPSPRSKKDRLAAALKANLARRKAAAATKKAAS
jgi:hypothetical protein